MSQLLLIFLALKTLQSIAESWLSWLNRKFYMDPSRQASTCKSLKIGSESFAKTLAYTLDTQKFSFVSGWINLFFLLVFLAVGGLGATEDLAQRFAAWCSGGSLCVGLAFFGIFGLCSLVFSLPFSWYQTFVIEERHGFNRQSKRQFWIDQIKGIFLAALLGAPLLAGLLYVMEVSGKQWWVWAWGIMSGFSLVAAWLYPTFFAPLFNKFSKMGEGRLKDGIFALASKVGFKASGIYVMDASIRSSHGNAYFTGMFGAKRIVLFDTLLKALTDQEVVAVLAHELGHFKLNHVRSGLISGILMTGGMFYLMSLCYPLENFYTAFALEGVSSYAALLVFILWFGILDFFFLQPVLSFMSRKNEFEADAFAKSHLGAETDLVSALLKLRESNHGMPLCHPWFSMVYHSHPPLMERFSALQGSDR